MRNPNAKYFAAILPSPRPTFPMDMSGDEKLIMKEHSDFWQVLLGNGTGVITGPVLDPKGAFGFGGVIADSLEDAKAILANDPAQKINEFEIYQMLAELPEN